MIQGMAPRAAIGTVHPTARGAALLEVIIALALFVATAAIITSALSASLESLDRQRRSTHAANLAASVLAELQLGIRSAGAGASAQQFEPPFDNWTWEAAITPTETELGETSNLSQIEVIIRHKESSTIRRLTEVVPLDRSRRTTTPTPAVAPQL